MERMNNMINEWGSFSVGTWDIPKMGLLVFIIALTLVLILNYMLRKFLNKRKDVTGEIETIYNSIYFFQKLIVAIVIIVLGVNLLNINSDYVTIISGIIITAVMFASVKSLNNFVAGIYLTVTRPFVIGDFVNVKNVEGLVIEITLNYTKIRHKDASITSIPNLICLKSNIVNYTISIKSFQKRIEKLERNIMVKNIRLGSENSSKLRQTIQKLDEELLDTNTTLNEIISFQENFLKKKKDEKSAIQRKKTKAQQKRKAKLEKKMKDTLNSVKDLFDQEDEKEKSYQESVKQVQMKKKKVKSVPETEVKKNLEQLNQARQDANEKFDQNNKDLVKKEFAELQESITDAKYQDKKAKYAHEHSQYVDEDKIIRFTFVLSLEKKPLWNAKCLDEVCGRWKAEFEITPAWCITGIGGRMDYQFTIITPDPYDIIHYYDEFVKDVYKTVYA